MSEKLPIAAVIDILFKDDEKLKASDKWPIVVDPSERVGMMAKYQNCNMISVLEIKSEGVLRNALLGALRYGKPLIIDTGDMDMWTHIIAEFKKIGPNMLEDVLSKKVLKDKNFLKIANSTDDEQYQTDVWNTVENIGWVQNFKFVLLSKIAQPGAEKDLSVINVV